MSNRIFGRLLGASASAMLLLSLVASPAAAAHMNRWVDDDLTAGDGPAKCDTAAYDTIQGAIDASSAGDWVYVCPGTYSEQLTIPTGVKVKARPLHGATLEAPGDGSGTLVTINGNNAQLRGFRINFAADAPPPTVNPGFIYCGQYDAAVWVRGSHDYVRNNLIQAVGGGTLTGDCGYDYGIVVGTTLTSANARVTFNWVTDFKKGGILVQGANSYAWVRRNTVRFFHETDCGPVAISCTASATSSVTPSVNGAFAGTFGIGVESGARADIIRNWVGSGQNACSTGPSYSCEAGSTPVLNDGISLIGLDGSETTDIHDNVVTRALGGIVTRAFADGAVIHDNLVFATHYGYQVGGDNDEWYDNRASNNDFGISVGGSGNNIHDNDFRHNMGTDCYDGTTGAGSEDTANTWTHNLGNIQSPDGICIPDAP